MTISRRLFVSSGLVGVVGVCYFKGLPNLKGLPILSNDIESFFESYELSIPVEESSDASGETEILEKISITCSLLQVSISLLISLCSPYIVFL